MKRFAFIAALALSAFTLGVVVPAPVEAAARRATKSAPAQSKGRKTSSTAKKPAATKARPTPTPPPARPDRVLFQSATNAEKKLRASPRLKSKRTEWEKVATAFRTVVDRYPRSPYCDDALLRAGDIQREMAKTFNNRKYSDQALEAYGQIVDEYPASSLGESALYASYEIFNERTQKANAKEAAEKYLAAYPDGKRAKELKNALAAVKAERPTRTAAARPSESPSPLSLIHI